MKEKITLRILSDGGEKFFGKGVAQLLHYVDAEGSLNMAAKRMNLSYSKAWNMLNKAEEELGFHFVERTSGGKNGGGSVLTAEGRRFVDQFDTFQEDVEKTVKDLFVQSFLFDNRYSFENITNHNRLVVVRGGGDIATGTIHRLHRCGYRVLILECEKPTAIRRKVSFCEAVYDDTAEVEAVTCRRAADLEACEAIWQQGEIPLLVDAGGDVLRKLQPSAVIDAILAKKNLGTNRSMAPLTIALGPGFEAGKDVDYVVETMRGHKLGRIIEAGYAMANTGIPGDIKGYGRERVIHAPVTGIIRNVAEISDMVEKDQTLAYIGDTPVRATLTGVLRGIIRDGFEVKQGLKIADIDPRGSEQGNCFTISDKARCIAGGVLEILLRSPGAGK
ncbi:selenium-dependent molybdenum cofactor biosynthesis protein YqeB [Hespellia stercorisuis]|uniref:Selenium-dependent molybdenum hydroxylase system protein, YqeB family n=1 Tax=Hespellia stercorisuis DSM 15480 TaxID=1121950 RepID=A0A1M6UE52_9FIRM|nr:selenium-dependent molybdenum cofactor biosynthesis protein YqeB [Hespellia stercorisuis]SHK67456.1 selenium-dependent molybdenum hydroxylase system protein, YqeB family [Hespellia stercorisuis DSM 15480]